MSEGSPEINVGIAFRFEPAALASFETISPRLRLRVTEQTDQAAIDSLATDDLDGLIGRSLPTDPTGSPNLRWLQVLSAGVENVVGDGAGWPARVVLTNARGAYATSIAQYTIAAILRVAERMDLRREVQLQGHWFDGPEDALLGQPVRGSTLVIVA